MAANIASASFGLSVTHFSIAERMVIDAGPPRTSVELTIRWIFGFSNSQMANGATVKCAVISFPDNSAAIASGLGSACRLVLNRLNWPSPKTFSAAMPSTSACPLLIAGSAMRSFGPKSASDLIVALFVLRYIGCVAQLASPFTVLPALVLSQAISRPGVPSGPNSTAPERIASLTALVPDSLISFSFSSGRPRLAASASNSLSASIIISGR